MKKFLILPLIALVFMGAGCLTLRETGYSDDAQKVSETQMRIQDSVPIPDIKTSLERENIAKRAQTFDVQNKVSYIYLVSYGKVMAFYSVSGKVSSLNSFLSPLDQLVSEGGVRCEKWMEGCYVVSAPDIDGAYGENDGGIFFFTTDGVYVEWHGDYLFVDEPLQFTTPPELIRNIE